MMSGQAASWKATLVWPRLRRFGERVHSRVNGIRAQQLFDSQKLIVLRGAIRPAEGSRRSVQLVATAMSAMVASSVSPDRCEHARYAFRWASSTASNISVSEPIWFTFTRIAFAVPVSILRGNLTLVTNRSSPSWTRSP
jgi:hypothetical protein